MTNKDFDKKIGDSLRHYEETPPPGIFDRIEKTLATETPLQAPVARKLAGHLYRYVSVAAAVAVAFIAVLHFTGRDGDAESTEDVAADTHSPYATEEMALKGKIAEFPLTPSDHIAGAAIGREASPSRQGNGRRTHSPKGENDHAPSPTEFSGHSSIAPGSTAPQSTEASQICEQRRQIHPEGSDTPASPEGNPAAPTPAIVLTQPDESDTGESDTGESDLARRTQEYWDKLIAQDNAVPKRRHGKKVGGSMYAGNFGSFKGDLHTDDPDRAASAGMLIKQTADKGTPPYSGGLQEDNGKPVLAPGDPVTQGINLHHRMPLNVGLSLAIPLNDRLALTTGLNYSYLYSSSDQAFTAGHAGITRELHYIGVPLALSYTFYRAGDFGFYVQAGGMVEKAVAWRETQNFTTGQDTGQKQEWLKAKGVQFSVNAAAGISYDFSRYVGLYIEPGVTYYFDQKDQPANYRTAHPASFAVRIGVKFVIR